jgi:hypothetical protein
MRLKKYLWLTTAILLALDLVSCNISKAPEPTADANAVYTSVAGTMIAQMSDQLTQTAQAVPPTPLASPTLALTLPPVPTILVEATLASPSTNAVGSIPPLTALTSVSGTPAAIGTPSSSTAVGCADSIFVADITIPDDTVEKANTVFQKVWRMKNTGTCAWGNGFKFTFAYGAKMGTGNPTITLTANSVPAGGSKDFGISLTAPSIPNTYTGCWKMQTDQGYWFGQAACVTIKVSP